MHQTRDEWKTAFKTELSLYEYTVMPFGFMNTPSSFQKMMDEVLRDLHECAVWYIDDILVHTGDSTLHDSMPGGSTPGDSTGGNDNYSEAVHKQAVESVLSRLMEHDLAVNLAKSVFHVRRVEFLGFIFGEDTFEMESGKI